LSTKEFGSFGFRNSNCLSLVSETIDSIIC
jgi:hypothetical protein